MFGLGPTRFGSCVAQPDPSHGQPNWPTRKTPDPRFPPPAAAALPPQPTLKPSPPARPPPLLRCQTLEKEAATGVAAAAAARGGGLHDRRGEGERMGIFEPFRAIGYITAGGVPFSVQRLGTETFVTVSVGKAFHVYNVSRHPTACPRLFYRLKKKTRQGFVRRGGVVCSAGIQYRE